MRKQLLRVGMSQMSAGSKTDVGAYHRQGGGRGGVMRGAGGSLGERAQSS